MLVLSRKNGESLIINGELEIKIIEISGDKVRIGVEAPQSYRILRKELQQTVETNHEAAHPPTSIRALSGLAERIKNQQVAVGTAHPADE